MTAADALDADWRQLSPRIRWVRAIELSIGTVPVVVVVAAAIAVGGGGAWTAVGATGVVAAGAVLWAFLLRRIRAWGYAERDDDLLVRRGVMFRRLSVIPYGRMQYIDVTAGPVERSFGLATVRMYTAAAASDARIPGLASNEAARLRDNLTELGEARATGL